MLRCKINFRPIFLENILCVVAINVADADIFDPVVLLGVSGAGGRSYSYIFCNYFLINLNFLCEIMYYFLKQITTYEILLLNLRIWYVNKQ